jgi:catechol 2,3-dioxygenase-like lactoylglutathione lyase family enzyme
MKSFLSLFVVPLAAALATVDAFQSSSLLSSNSARIRRRLHQLSHSSSPISPTSTTSASNSLNAASSPPAISTAIQSHHVAVKTRNIENAIKFYSLLGFHVETKFVAGPARAAWLLHGGNTATDKNESLMIKSRIELIEVPDYILNEPEGKIKRALDLTKREELLGLNHFCLDVTQCIPKPTNTGDESLISNIDADTTTVSEDGSSSCSLYNLQEWMDDLNELSISTFGKSLRVALQPTKRIIGRDVYEMAFIYDADGTLVELLNWSGSLEQEVGDGWEPWNGEGFVL